MKTLLTFQVLLGAMVMAAQVDRTLESQIDRFGRTGGKGLFVWEGRHLEGMEEPSSRLHHFASEYIIRRSIVIVSCQSLDN